MKIICEKCQGKYNVAEEKLPEGKQFGFTCPKCKHKISVTKARKPEVSTDEEIVFSLAGDEPKGDPSKKESPKKEGSKPSKKSPLRFDEEDSSKPSISFAEDESIYDASEKPFDFVEEDYETAMICESDPAIREKIKIALELMEYSITMAENTREALKNMRYHTYDLIVLNERFDTPNPDVNGILIYLNRLVMAERRKITLFLLTDRYRTMDPMEAYHRSANAVVNIKDIDRIDTILQKGLNDSSVFYKIFKEFLIQAGKI
ncbi:MAG: zinc-ribbon domain-containing protein [Proteobacteria bacterium]|nr:zinc-ribbon domain-containing protein [Pseudomonadota bacterium]